MSISALREELNKSKQKEELITEEAAMAWLQENVIPLNEATDPKVLKHLIDLVQRFDDKLRGYGEKLPTISAIIDNAENELNQVVSGSTKYRSKKRTGELLQSLTSVYNHLSDLFRNKLKIVLSAPMFKRARDEANSNVPLRAIEGIDYDMMINAFYQALKPSSVQRKLWGRIVNGASYDSMVKELASMSYSELMDLVSGVPKVPVVVATVETPAEEQEAASGGTPGAMSPLMSQIVANESKMTKTTEEDQEEEEEKVPSAGDAQIMNEAEIVHTAILETLLEGYNHNDLETLSQEVDMVMEAGIGPGEISNFAGFVQLNKLMSERAVLTEQLLTPAQRANSTIKEFLSAAEIAALPAKDGPVQQAAQQVARHARPRGLMHRVGQKIATWMKGGAKPASSTAQLHGAQAVAGKGAATKAASATATTAAGHGAGAAAGLGGLAAGLVGAAGAGATAYAGKEYYKYKTREDVKTLVPAMNAIGNALKGLPAGAGIQKLKNDAVKMSDPSKKFGDFKLKDTNERHIAMITVADMFTALQQAKAEIEQNYLSEMLQRMQKRSGKLLTESKIRQIVRESKKTPHRSFFKAVILKEAIETDDDLDAVMTTIRGSLTQAINQHSGVKNKMASAAGISVKPVDALKKYGLTPDEIADSIHDKLKGMNPDARDKYIRNFFTQADKAGEMSAAAVTQVAANAAKEPAGGTSTTGGDKGGAPGSASPTATPTPQASGQLNATPTVQATGTGIGGDAKPTDSQQDPEEPPVLPPNEADARAPSQAARMVQSVEQQLYAAAKKTTAESKLKNLIRAIIKEGAVELDSDDTPLAADVEPVAAAAAARPAAPGIETNKIAQAPQASSLNAGQVASQGYGNTLNSMLPTVAAPPKMKPTVQADITPQIKKYYETSDKAQRAGIVDKLVSYLQNNLPQGFKLPQLNADWVRSELKTNIAPFGESTRKPAIVGSKRWIQERKLIYLNYELALLESGYVAV